MATEFASIHFLGIPADDATDDPILNEIADRARERGKKALQQEGEEWFHRLRRRQEYFSDLLLTLFNAAHPKHAIKLDAPEIPGDSYELLYAWLRSKSKIA